MPHRVSDGPAHRRFHPAVLIGLALATLVFPYSAKFIPGLQMPVSVVVVGVVAACIVSLLSGSLPALRAARLRVVDALAGR